MKLKLYFLLFVAMLITLTACINNDFSNNATQEGSSLASDGTIESSGMSTFTSETSTEKPTLNPTDDTTETPTEQPTEAPTDASTEPPKDPRLVELEALFRWRQGNWYNFALTSYYDSPEKVDLYKLFYNGIPGSPRVDLTEDEKNQLWSVPGFEPYMDLVCLPEDMMNGILEQYFGITLADCDLENSGLYYMESKHCYFICVSDVGGCYDLVLEKLEEQHNGLIVVFYIANGKEGAVELMPYGDGYRIVGNYPR